MTDLEISKSLALAIGYLPENVTMLSTLQKVVVHHESMLKLFDYRDWNVISPIAERYDCFPHEISGNRWRVQGSGDFVDTPQKAIALEVIKGDTK